MRQIDFHGGGLLVDADWINVWSKRYPNKKYSENIYLQLIGKCGRLTRDDFLLIGAWKDGGITDERFNGKWKQNTSAAYEIWMLAANKEPPLCCPQNISAFLAEWSEKRYHWQCWSGIRTPRFGLSRATALLHFLTSAKYPIFDSRARMAMSDLAKQSLLDDIQSYWKYCDLFQRLRGVADSSPRVLDKALFAYGRHLSSKRKRRNRE